MDRWGELCIAATLAVSMAGQCRADVPNERLLTEDWPVKVSEFCESDLGALSTHHDITLTSCLQRGESCGSAIDCCSRVQDDHGLRFQLTEFNIYPTFSYLDDLAASYNEFEFASLTQLGSWEMENRTVLNVSDLPGTIALGPTNPFGAGNKIGVRAQGLGDVLSGFFFSPKNSDRKSHLGVGPVFTFPSATDDILGSAKYTVGPGAHFTTELSDDLEFGFFVWQSWTFAGDESQKDVNQLFGKPFLIYELNEKWNLIYIPLGLSYSWKSPGNKATVPLGGGVRRLFEVHGQKMGFQLQLFDYVARKSKDPEWEVRMTIEFLFGE